MKVKVGMLDWQIRSANTYLVLKVRGLLVCSGHGWCLPLPLGPWHQSEQENTPWKAGRQMSAVQPWGRSAPTTCLIRPLWHAWNVLSSVDLFYSCLAPRSSRGLYLQSSSLTPLAHLATPPSVPLISHCLGQLHHFQANSEYFLSLAELF